MKCPQCGCETHERLKSYGDCGQSFEMGLIGSKCAHKNHLY